MIEDYTKRTLLECRESDPSKRRLGRPRLGEARGPRADWWKEYSSTPEFKKHRREYMRKRREALKKTHDGKWTPAAYPPRNGKIVQMAVEMEDETQQEDVWEGYYDKAEDCWYLVDGTPVHVTHWMLKPLSPRKTGE